jgi:hypothetical protein
MLLRLVTLLLAGSSCLAAQGMSEDYVRARTEAKYSKPYGIGVEWDVFAHVPYFEQRHQVRANGLGGDSISYTRDMDAPPIGVFLDTELRVRFSWHDSIEAGYGFHVLRAFKDELDERTRFNGVIYPQGVDIDYGSDWHDFRLHYRRDLFRLGLAKDFTFYLTVGLEWTYLKVQVGSDSFPVRDDRDEEYFRELLPWWNAGLGMQIELGPVRLTADARGTYAVGYPTFQRRDDETMKQSIVSLTGVVTFEYAITDWFSLIVRAKGRYFFAKLYGGFRSDRFVWYSVGPELGIGLRF